MAETKDIDIKVSALHSVREATEESSAETERKLAASRRGGLIGGRHRAQALSPEERTRIAQKASRARWAAKNL